MNSMRFLGKKNRDALLLSGLGLATFALCSVVGIVLSVQIPAASSIRSIEELAPHPDVIMILGAGIEDENTPSDALMDRLIVGERVSRALEAPMMLTGDGGKFRRPETAVMSKWLLNRGVSPDRLIIDEEGYRTYESCKRAARVYRIKRAVIVTQRFHLGRAIYLCRSFGIEVYGVPANTRPYRKDFWFVTRDVLASVKAWADIHFLHPAPPV